jgi:imidazoleglycerol-phosphate dehydratase
MDEALSSVVADMGGRPFLVFDAAFPQPSCGGFDTALVREFLYALAVNSGLCLHAQCEYGDNSHHMVEALFKALGIAIAAPCAGTRAASGRPRACCDGWKALLMGR